jgi:protein ImuB
VPPGEQVEALAPLAVEALRLPAPTLTALHQLGLYQIGQVAELPRASLASRFQHEGQCVLLERLDQAFGAVEELITPHRPPPEFRAECCFEYPVERTADVQAILAGLFDNVCRELAARGQGALRSVCRLDCEGGEVRKLDLGLFQPTASASRLLELAAMQLERLRLPGGVGRMSVEIEIAAPLTIRQQALFAEEGRSRPRELAYLIERLSSRLGPNRVVRPRLLPDAQPERAFCEETLIGEKPKAESGKQKKRLKQETLSSGFLLSAFRFPSSAFHFPLSAFPRPLPIDVVALADGPPASFRIGRRRFRVHACWGPERIETAWWRGRSIRRDYYQVETTTGARYWLFRRLRDRRWFVHGEFG